MIEYIIFIASLIALTYSADTLVKGSSGIGLNLGLSKGFIGLTIVSAGTSLPEFFVSASAAFSGSADIALGNVLGSNNFNVLMILGITAIVTPLAIRSFSVKMEWPIMYTVTVLFFLFARDGVIDRLEAGFFAVAFFAFLYYSYQMAIYEKNKSEQEVSFEKRSLWIDFFFIIAGGIGLAVSGHFMVQSSVNIAQKWGVTERIIGLTIVSTGTSLPELVTNLVAAYRKETEMAVGNILGSNIFNILFVIGFAALAQPISVSADMLNFDFLVCLASSLIIFPFMINGNKINRWEGILLFMGYVCYLYFLVEMK